MKYLLVGFVAWFMIAFGLQIVKAWILELIFKWKKRHASIDKKWMYE